MLHVSRLQRAGLTQASIVTRRHHTAPSAVGALAAALDRATGADARLDAALHALVAPGGAVEAPSYTGSVDACLALVRALLPDWRWHVGHGATGVLPYATLSRGEVRFAADGPTVPLALLRAAVRAIGARGHPPA